MKLGNLRFLGVYLWGSLPSTIQKLQNLQTLMVNFGKDRDLILPYEVWEISCLRHIIMKQATIYVDFKIPRVHENLQTIRDISLGDLLASNLINNIPNIKELKIYAYQFDEEDRVIHLSHLHKLETLKFVYVRVPFLWNIELPSCLKKLSLCACMLPMGLINGVGDLQCLQVIKINCCEFRSDKVINAYEWELSEGVELCSLQFLKLKFSRIKRWEADYSHFPILKHLRIVRCRDLKEMPACIAEMSTLEMIEVDEDNRSLMDWANEVRETQRNDYGNETLQVRLG